MSINKKLVSAALAATTILWAVGAAALPLANAQTTSTASLQAQIASLLAEIQTLQAQLNTQGGSTASAGASYNFSTSDLTIGSKGAGVTTLQQFLIAQGDLTAVSAPTGYFGTLTQKALAKFQTANGIKPASGYYGPITRAYLAKYQTSSSTGTTGSTGTGSTGTGSTTGVTAPATGLQVSMGSQSVGTSLIAGSSRVPVLSVNLTAGNSGAVTVSQLQFQKTGVVSDSGISGAYLVQNGVVVAQYSSLSNGVLTFSGMNLQIPAGQTVSLQVAVDVSTGLTAGNSVGFAMTGASSVTAFDTNNTAVTAMGSFPINGPMLTVTTVTNPDLAKVSIASSSIGTTVTAGSQGNIVGAWTASVANSAVYLQNVSFHVIGSANMANIQNVKLMVNGTQVGNTLSAVPANGIASFSGSAKLNTGTNNIQVVADVMGSPSYNFQFEILNSFDVLAVDSQYNVPVAVTNSGGVGTQVNIQQGQITMSQDANTPTGNIAKVSGVTLAKYDIYAAGEPVKVKYLDFNIALGGVATTSQLTIGQELQNLQLVDDAGNQVGTSINVPPTSNVCAATNANAGYTVSTSTAVGTYTDCFGTPSSPINYIVPANTTRVLSFKADIQNTADFSSITANLTGNTNNLQGMISSQTGSTSGVNGVTLTLVPSSLSASMNNALGSQNVSAGTSNVKIGSYSLSASSAEGVNVNTVSIQLTPGTTTWNGGSNNAAFQNLKLYVNGVQFGTTQSVLNPGSTYVFSGSPISVPAGQTVNVDVYADTLSNATGTYNHATALVGYTGSGATSYTSVTSNTAQDGQQITFSGNPTLLVANDSSNPSSGLIAQNTTGDTLAVFRMTETSNVEAVKVTQLNVVDTVSTGTVANFSNLKLYNGSTLLGTAAAPTQATGTFTFAFTGLTGLVVPQGQSLSVTLKGDAGSYTGGSITDNSSSTFSVSNASIVAYGNTSNKTATVSGSASGNPQTVVRSYETVTGTPVTSLPPASLQQIGSVTITSNAAGDTVPQNLTLTFNGTAYNASTTGFLGTVELKDGNGNPIMPSGTSTSNITATWDSSKIGSYVVTAGGSYTFQVWGDLSQIPSVPNAAQSLTAQIKNTGDYQYNDASTNGSPVSLPTIAVPITVVSMTSPVGGQF